LVDAADAVTGDRLLRVSLHKAPPGSGERIDEQAFEE